MIYQRMQLLGQAPQERSASKARVAPVEVAPIEHGSIQLRRTFSGTLETQAEFVVAPEVGGRVVKLDPESVRSPA